MRKLIFISTVMLFVLPSAAWADCKRKPYGPLPCTLTWKRAPAFSAPLDGQYGGVNVPHGIGYLQVWITKSGRKAYRLRKRYWHDERGYLRFCFTYAPRPTHPAYKCLVGWDEPRRDLVIYNPYYDYRAYGWRD